MSTYGEIVNPWIFSETWQWWRRGDHKHPGVCLVVRTFDMETTHAFVYEEIGIHDLRMGYRFNGIHRERP